MVDLTGSRIMVVEDEFLIAMDVEDALSAAGARVVGPYATLEGAQRAARIADIDAAILDIDLHGDEVFPAAQLLLERGIPFIFHTGRPDRPILSSRFRGVPVCVKPMSTFHLLRTVEQLRRIAA